MRKSDSERRFYFDTTDTIPYWYEPAIGIFNDVAYDEFLDVAERWVVEKWNGDKETSHWVREPRRKRYSEMDFNLWSHSHGTYPTVERYWNYLEWHAMCCTVGEFLASKTCFKDVVFLSHHFGFLNCVVQNPLRLGIGKIYC